MKKLFLTICLIISLVFSQAAFAAETGNEGVCAHNEGPNGESCVYAPKIPKPDLLPGPSMGDTSADVHERYFITDLIPTLIRGAINLLGGITIIALMIGGIQYLTAYGDDTRMENGKKTITYSLIGLFLALFSFTIVSIISEVPLSNRGENPVGVSDEVTTE